MDFLVPTIRPDLHLDSFGLTFILDLCQLIVPSAGFQGSQNAGDPVNSVDLAFELLQKRKASVFVSGFEGEFH
jgi:hypothetical protein